MEENLNAQENNVEEYSDQDIMFETDAVQSNYQNRMRDDELSLNMPETAVQEQEEAEQQKEELAEPVIGEEPISPPAPATQEDPNRGEQDYYNQMAAMYSEMEEDFGFEDFNPADFAPGVGEQYKKNEEQIKKAEELGADKEDVIEMLSFNKEKAEESKIIKKAQEFEQNPFLTREYKREQKEILNTLQKFGKKVENANLMVGIKGKEVYKGITKPFRELSRAGHHQRGKYLEKRLERQQRKLTTTIERADERASIKRNKIRQRKGVALEVEAYRSVRDQKKINRLNHVVDRTVIAANTERAMIDRSIAYEARIQDRIEKSRDKRRDVKELLASQPTKEEMLVIKKERQHEKVVNALEADIRKRDALARAAELDELTKNAKEERKEVKAQIKDIKKSVLDGKIEEAELAGSERAMEKQLAVIEKNLMTGKSVVVETEQDKFRVSKEITGELKLERWDDKRQMYEQTSKKATISAWAKDQGIVTRHIDALFEGNTKAAPEKEERETEEPERVLR